MNKPDLRIVGGTMYDDDMVVYLETHTDLSVDGAEAVVEVLRKSKDNKERFAHLLRWMRPEEAREFLRLYNWLPPTAKVGK
jgi:hypothetical protein